MIFVIAILGLLLAISFTTGEPVALVLAGSNPVFEWQVPHNPAAGAAIIVLILVMLAWGVYRNTRELITDYRRRRLKKAFRKQKESDKYGAVS